MKREKNRRGDYPLVVFPHARIAAAMPRNPMITTMLNADISVTCLNYFFSIRDRENIVLFLLGTHLLLLQLITQTLSSLLRLCCSDDQISPRPPCLRPPLCGVGVKG